MSDTWECAECQVDNDLDDDPEEGQIVECAECGAEFEIVAVEPLEMVALDIPESDDDVPEAEVEAEEDAEVEEDEDEDDAEEDWD